MISVLTIAGSDSGGGAGIQADLLTIGALGAHGLSVIVALTAQNTSGVKAVRKVELDFIEKQLEAVFEDFSIQAVKTGMLWEEEVIEIVCSNFKKYQVKNLVVDPVMVAKSGDRLLKEEAVLALKEKLFPLAKVITPNLPEAEALLGFGIRSRKEMVEAGKRLLDFGPQAVLLKGGHLEDEPWDLLIFSKGHLWLKGERIPWEAHGTGCSFSAALATFLGMGYEVQEAALRAKRFVQEGIRMAKSVGRGFKVVDPLASLRKGASRWEVIKGLKEAYHRLESKASSEIIPEVGSNLVYALEGAQDEEEVAGIEGRIVKVGKTFKRVGEIDFGASRHMARLVLEVMRFYPFLRSVMNIRYDPIFIEKGKKMGFKILSLDRKKEPEDVKRQEGASLRWMVREVLKEVREVPDLIYDEGDIGKEPMIRVLGKDPQEVVDKVLKLSGD
jgi:hydroxymethylpyrimidine kinase/phosphomethylpyrimidine kinase